MLLNRLDPADPITPDSVDELVARAAADDEEAVAALYRQYLGALTAYASRWGAEDAEGVANLAFVAGLQALPRFRSQTGAAFRAYVYRAAKNRVIGEWRRSKLDVIPLIEDRGTADGPTIEEAVAAQAGFETLLDMLTPAQRQVMVHLYFDGLSVSETAHAVGRSPEAVRGLQHRGLVRLRTLATVAVLVLLAGLAATLLRPRSAIVTEGPAEAPVELPPVLDGLPDPAIDLSLDGRVSTTSATEVQRLGPETPRGEDGPAEPIESSRSVTPTTPLPASTASSGSLDVSPTSVSDPTTTTALPSSTTWAPPSEVLGAGRLVPGHAGDRCLGIVNGSTAQNAYVELQDCDGSPGQWFALRSHLDGFDEWVALHSGHCVHIDSNSGLPGARVLTNHCGGVGANAHWSFDAGRLVARSTGMCLMVDSASVDPGAALIQAPCQPGLAHQTFTLITDP